MPWTFLGAGNYNSVYIDEKQKRVLKIQKIYGQEYDDPIRSVRIWNEINNLGNPPASLVEVGNQLVWTCPFIKGIQASDEEMHIALLDIYSRTGRIVVDAVSPKNFVKTDTGQIVCVDIGMALRMEKRDVIPLRKCIFIRN